MSGKEFKTGVQLSLISYIHIQIYSAFLENWTVKEHLIFQSLQIPRERY